MKTNTVFVFSRLGMGNGPEELQKMLARKFLSLTLESEQLPAQILFMTDGVKLACSDSPVLDVLRQYEQQGTELVLCQTCLDFFGLSDQVQVGIIGGMGDMITAMQHAEKVIHL